MNTTVIYINITTECECYAWPYLAFRPPFLLTLPFFFFNVSVEVFLLHCHCCRLYSLITGVA